MRKEYIVFVVLLSIFSTIGCTSTTNTPTPNQTSTPTQTEIKETSNNQDKAWKNLVESQNTLLSDDMNKLIYAQTNHNIDDLQTYSTALTTDAKTALNESDSYSVSSSLQPAKEKYETALFYYYQGGYFDSIGASTLKSRNTAQGNQHISLATSYLKSGIQNMNDVASLIKKLANSTEIKL